LWHRSDDGDVLRLGIDLSPNMVAEAGRLNPALTFHVGSMTDLPFEDSRFGGI
jgi:ubiquinone/menaquinone biosynthesis C-methylase UbiE